VYLYVSLFTKQDKTDPRIDPCGTGSQRRTVPKNCTGADFDSFCPGPTLAETLITNLHSQDRHQQGQRLVDYSSQPTTAAVASGVSPDLLSDGSATSFGWPQSRTACP
jgi:hypothetical protein